MRPIAILAVAAAALLAVAALILALTGSPVDSPAAPERLEEMDCKALAVEVLEGGKAKRRAAFEIFVRRKCF